MDKKDYIAQVENLNAEQIVEGILKEVITLGELQATGNFDASKRKAVKNLLSKKDDETFTAATTAELLRQYLSVFPSGKHATEARTKIQTLQAQEWRRDTLLREIEKDINKYDTDDINTLLSDDELDDLCSRLGIDAQMVKDYREPVLKYNDIPQEESDVPVGYTDIFFWGIPSSGKTCALSAIFSTIKRDYSMEAPDCEKKFGATYRDSLINIFRSNFAYLPGRTNMDVTQYMPFMLYKRGEKNKRKISFFELSGEVFKHFYEEANNTQIIDFSRDHIEKAFQILKLLLKSNNQKIHFFFIDYNQETKHTADSYGLTQDNYLDAAATYFRDNNQIFRKKTDAVYVVITKSDEIPGKDKDKNENAKRFLDENFGSFMDVLKNQCNKYSVNFRVKLFSIGDVYFKKICKINRDYSDEIIKELLERVKPVSGSRIRIVLNS
ncbi:MAG: hypothetical protein LBD80_02960 [Tannerella sp.]|jgi:hypothetical protein|nr:hypothetical protein [Tannerella sp.]